jgi:putative nucleotidyltransferase with HDIG domain
MAEPLAGGELVDPHGGRRDLDARRIRMVSPGALEADPLRAIRAVRLASELACTIEPATLEAVRAHAPQLAARVAPERIFAELKRVVGAADPVAAVQLMTEAGVTAAVLPELLELRGVAQNVYHHADVHEHTLEVLAAAARLEREPGLLDARIAPVLAEPLADELTRWGGLRFAALLHDIAKPATRAEWPDGGVSFLGHDRHGAEMVRDILRRLRASAKLAEHVAALTEHHLRLGFLVHERPLSRRSVYRYLTLTAPRTIDVTVLTVADRLATRGRNAEPAIEAHLALARRMLDEAFAYVAPEEPLIRGDELARALGVAPGPQLGELLAELEEDRFAGEVTTRAEAIEAARRRLRSA